MTFFSRAGERLFACLSFFAGVLAAKLNQDYGINILRVRHRLHRLVSRPLSRRRFLHREPERTRGEDQLRPRRARGNCHHRAGPHNRRSQHHAHPAQLRTARSTGRRHADAEGGGEINFFNTKSYDRN